MIDKMTNKAAIAITTGALTLTTKLFMNPAAAAAFAAVTSGQAYPTVTLDDANGGVVKVVLVVTPDTAVGIVAEGYKFIANENHPGAGTIL